ncbi:MAG: TrkH family potassium uptake protein [bacterium]|nr:TrkH family potassium uptake protein [bacterium]
MNLRSVISQLGILMLVLSGVILAIACWSGVGLLRGDAAELHAFRALLLAAAIGVALGFSMWVFSRGKAEAIGRRDALLLVAASWILGAAVAALPFFIWANLENDAQVYDLAFASYIDAYFEAMSGLTTTGATVLSRIDTLPRSLLLWRSLTHWLGGLGIVVLFVAVLPMLGVGGKRLFRVEAPGPTSEGVRPRIQETARALWLIYLGLTAAEIVLLMVMGLDLFDAVCHTFATLATGGFSTRNASVGELDSLGVDVVVIVFMVLAGVNFGLYYSALRGRWRDVLHDSELRAYLGLLAVGSIIIIACLWGHYIQTTDGRELAPSIGSTARHGVFQVVAIQTTTGFCTANFDLWPFVPKMTLLLLMFVGGCGGSTGGGIKVVRIVIAVKVLLAEIEHVFRPNVVRTIRLGRTTVDPEFRQGVLAYIMIVVGLFVAGTAVLMVLESGSDVDITTAATATIATLNNIGPGLARVGAIENFGWFSDGSKLVMCLLMALGRLEVYAIAVLFLPRFWRGD